MSATAKFIATANTSTDSANYWWKHKLAANTVTWFHNHFDLNAAGYLIGKIAQSPVAADVMRYIAIHWELETKTDATAELLRKSLAISGSADLTGLIANLRRDVVDSYAVSGADIRRSCRNLRDLMTILNAFENDLFAFTKVCKKIKNALRATDPLVLLMNLIEKNKIERHFA